MRVVVVVVLRHAECVTYAKSVKFSQQSAFLLCIMLCRRRFGWQIKSASVKLCGCRLCLGRSVLVVKPANLMVRLLNTAKYELQANNKFVSAKYYCAKDNTETKQPALGG